MSEGSLEAPVRHPISWKDPDFYDPVKLDAEMRRVLIFAMDVEDVLIYVIVFHVYLI